MNILSDLMMMTRKDQDEDIANYIKNLIYVLYSDAECSMKEYAEDNLAIQQVGLLLIQRPMVARQLDAKGADVNFAIDNNLCGVAANIACRKIAMNNDDLGAWQRLSAPPQAVAEFTEYFVALLAEYTERVAAGEYMGELAEKEGNKYPVYKTLTH